MKINSINRIYFKDTSFAYLMTERIYNVLMIASKYDAFMLEEDGRVDEQIFNEYVSLNLRYPPRFMLVNSEEEASKLLIERKFELIISMPSGDSITSFDWAKDVKLTHPDIPIVILTPFSKMVSRRLANEDLSGVDYVFSWLGNSDLLLAIIKLIEDKMNVEEDVKSVGVPVIMLVEDSVRFYSSLLPHLYKYVFVQSRSFMTEALNAHEQMLRMRGRPKIMLARNYEEAITIYKKYKNNMLGVISDVSFMENGVKNKQAGIKLCQEIRDKDKYIPLIIQSSDESNRSKAYELNAAFTNKQSKTHLMEMRSLITKNFGFGDFVFVNPVTGKEEARIHNLKGLQDNIFKVSDDSLYYHISRNHISRWMYSRAIYPLAEFLKNIHVESQEESDMQRIRQIIFDAIVNYRKIKNQGVIAVFQRDRFDKYSNFARIGEGSMGGKGRGLAFVDTILKDNIQLEQFENTQIVIPRTVVICTDVFDEFMEMNNLYPIALSDAPDDVILKHFLKARIPRHLLLDLAAFLNVVQYPIAVRSSSLLEDSHYQPFAGIYSTYMVPFDAKSKTNLLLRITEAIKAVYASVYYQASKMYMTATKNIIDEEKMSIILQEICGIPHANRFYPSFSGVARSLNFYPIGNERIEEGIANVAMGLGKYIVDGGMTLRFSPYHPNNVLQTSTLEYALKETQTYFFVLDLNQQHFIPQVDDGSNLLKINVQDALKDGTLKYLASTFDMQNQTLYDNVNETGRKVITFANILKHNVFPLAEILKVVLHLSQEMMGRPVEIEFAVNIDYSSTPSHTFYILQIRPIVDAKEAISEDLAEIAESEEIISCNNALGHGVYNDIYDVIYVKPEKFKAVNSPLIMSEIDYLNKTLQKQDKFYVLVGPGRWGSSDPWMGVPVKWQNISNAKIIVESGLSNYRVDPSQGTHFFQNLTSMGVAYFTINPYLNDGFYDVDFLNAQPAEFETEFIRHVHFKMPIVAKVDGRKGKGVILKPIVP